MNANTALIMFAVMAAFGLATATLAVPIVNQAHAAGGCPDRSSACKAFGQSQRALHQP